MGQWAGSQDSTISLWSSGKLIHWSFQQSRILHPYTHQWHSVLFLKWDGCGLLLQCQSGFLTLNKWGTESLPAAHSDLHYHWDHPVPCRQDNEPSYQRMKSRSCLVFLNFISGLSVLRLFDSASLSRYFLPLPPFQYPQIANWSLTVNQAEHPESDHQILPWDSHFQP